MNRRIAKKILKNVLAGRCSYTIDQIERARRRVIPRNSLA